MRRFSWFNATSLTLGFAFLYIPMIILVIYSFNSSKLVTVWAGFSTKWYAELMGNQAFLDAAWVTIKVAVISSKLDLGHDIGHHGGICAGARWPVFWPNGVFGNGVCSIGDARGDHGAIAIVIVHRHRSGSRGVYHSVGAHNV